MRPLRHSARLVADPVPTLHSTSRLILESNSMVRSFGGRTLDPTRTLYARVSATSLTLIVVLTLSVTLTLTQPASAFVAPCWRPPVVGEIVDHYRAPNCPYCAGNRGIEVATGGAVPVRAVEAGMVTFSGKVAGTVYVVVEHANGWKVTYGRLGSSEVDRDQRVARGALVGTSSGHFYFGVRVNGEYRNPELFLGKLTGRPRLIPIDGTVRRVAPTPTWICRT